MRLHTKQIEISRLRQPWGRGSGAFKITITDLTEPDMKAQNCKIHLIQQIKTGTLRRQRPFWDYTIRLGALLLVLQPLLPILASTPTIWNGPKIIFTKANLADPTQAANQDRMTANVWITRGDSHGIYNAKTETFFTHSSSPLDTEWANGTTANYNSLSYTDWNSWAKGVNAGPPSTVGVNAVVHLKSDNIYIDIKFLSWDESGTGGGFSYTRSTPAPPANNPPSVTITNPAAGATFSAPANITVQASASDTDGTVTNVQLFSNGNSVGTVTTAPYNFTLNNLAAGNYTLSAVATDNLNAAGTNSISISVTNVSAPPPSPVQIVVSPFVHQDEFDFSFLTQTGYVYTVQFTTSLDVINWLDLTNFPGDGSVAQVNDTTATNVSRFYRVGAR
jgi:hypothetical protein